MGRVCDSVGDDNSKAIFNIRQPPLAQRPTPSMPNIFLELQLYGFHLPQNKLI